MAAAAVLFTIFLAFTGCEQPGGTVNNPAPDSDAALRELTLSAGSLSPAFDPARTVYSAEVGNSVKAITVTGAANSRYAVVGGQNGKKRNLDVGLNPPIAITVTAQDGTEKTYTVTVTRLEKRLIVITSHGDLAKIGVDPDFSLAGEYRLETDLVLEHWVPIGGVFSGQFDGNHHTITIRGFAESVFLDKKTCLGVFGSIRGSADSKALVKDLSVTTEIAETISRTGVYYVGALTGYAGAYTELDNISVAGSLRFANTATGRGAGIYSGGVAGGLYGAELRNSRVSADIDAYGTAGNGSYNYVGGLAGIFEQDTVIDPDAPFGTAVSIGSSIVNCHNTGNVTGRTSGAQSNVFVGGIAGGSGYSFKTYYSGKIEDCSSTGNISARCEGGYWAFAGGIAGTIVGDGDGNPATGPTRIARSYATGNVTASTTSGGWPYAGGIVGYNYYGALVSQCYVTGTVIGEGGYDYTGGIAGYNAVSDGKAAGTVRNCVALNPSIDAPNGFDLVYRVIGNGGGTIADNRAYSGMAITVNGTPWSGANPGPNTNDGADCDEKPPRSVYEALGWDFDTVWEMGDDGYPILRWTFIVNE
ncbi:MAG: cadherin-like beta sandwich domain-containing protein [Treponema sp.]|jgi:hypothetical protein|nr:cadherin-like beta sandwich domain-containing protein [Treponema sp.]